MAETQRVEGVYTIKIEQGPALRAFEEVKKRLDDTRASIKDYNKLTKELIKAEQDVEAEIRRSGTATAEQSKRLQAVRAERERVNKVLSEAVITERALSSQTRELSNDIGGLTANGTRFRDKMSDAFTKALEGSQIFAQLGNRTKFLEEQLAASAATLERQRTELQQLRDELAKGAITQEQFAQASEELATSITKAEKAQEALATEAQQTEAAAKELEQAVAKLNEEFRQGLITENQYRQGLAKIDAEARKAGGGIGDFIRNFNDQFSGKNVKSELASLALQYVGIGAAIEGARRIIGSAVNTVLEFDQALARIRALGGEYAASIDLIADQARTAGTAFGFTATETLSAVEALAKAGVSTADILEGGLTGALTLAAAGNLDVGTSAEIAANAMTQFGLAGTDVTRIADLLAAGANSATGDVSDFAQALKQSGLVASQFGLSIEETIGTLTSFASAGLLGSDAGTSFRTMLLRLANPAGEAADTMERLGIAAFDSEGAFVGLENLAGQLQERLGDLTEEQRNAALATIFGTDAIRAASILYDQGAEGVANWTETVDQSGFAAKVAAEQQQTLTGELNRAKAAWEAFVLSVDSGSGVISQATKGVTRSFTDVLTLLSNGELSRAFAVLSGGAGSAAAQAALRANEALAAATQAANQAIESNKLENQSVAELEKRLTKLRDLREAFFRQGKVEAAQEGDAQISALEKEIAARREAARAEGQNAEAAAKGAETVAAARQRLTEEIAAEKAAKEQLAATDRAGIQLAQQNITRLEAELAALDGKTNSVKALTQAERDQLALQREIQALAQEGTTAITPIDQTQQTPLPQATPLVPTGDELLQGELFRLQEEARLRDLAGIVDYNAERILLEAEFAAGVIASREELNARLFALDREATAGQLAIQTEAAGALGQLFAEAATGRIEDERAFQKQLLLILFRAAKKQAQIAIATASTSALASPESVATGGIAGLAKSAVLSALIEGVFAGLEGVIQGLASGGTVGKPSGEVTSAWGLPINRSNGDNVLARAGSGMVTLRTGEKVLNDDQQKKLERIAGRGVWGAIGLPGYHSTAMRDFRRGMLLQGYAEGGTVGIVTPRPAPATVVQSQLSRDLLTAQQAPQYVSVQEIRDVDTRIEVIEEFRSL